jgi:hypothetical protein
LLHERGAGQVRPVVELVGEIALRHLPLAAAKGERSDGATVSAESA